MPLALKLIHAISSWDVERVKDVFIIIGSAAGLLNFVYNLTRDFLKRSKLVFQIEGAKLIEDYPGELGIQLSAKIKACNGSFLIRNIELRNKNDKINRKIKIKIDIRRDIEEDIILKYLEKKRKEITVKEKEGQRKKAFSYYSDCISGNPNYKLDDLGNSIQPDISSDFERSFWKLTRIQIYEEGRYQQPEKLSLHDLKIDDQSVHYFSLFFHLYGEFDTSLNKRAYLPLKGWKVILTHSEGKIEREPRIQAISYSQVKRILDEDKVM
jgi:hypothetical protein